MLEKESYSKVKKFNEELTISIESLKEENKNLTSQKVKLESLLKQNKNWENDNHSLTVKITDLFKENGEMKAVISNYENIIQDYENKLRSKKSNNNSRETKLIRSIQNDGLADNYIHLGKSILNNDPIGKNANYLREFVSLDLIKPGIEYGTNHRYYSFSELGKIIYDYFIDKKGYSITATNS